MLALRGTSRIADDPQAAVALVIVKAVGHGGAAGGIAGIGVVQPVAQSHQVVAGGPAVDEQHLVLRADRCHSGQRAGVGSKDHRTAVHFDVLNHVDRGGVAGGLMVVDDGIDSHADCGQIVPDPVQADLDTGAHQRTRPSRPPRRTGAAHRPR